MAQAIVAHVRQECHDAHARDDGRARPPYANGAVGGVLRCAQDAWRSDDSTAVRGRVPRDGIEAVELDSNAAIHDELVQQVHSSGRLARRERRAIDMRRSVAVLAIATLACHGSTEPAAPIAAV